MGTATCGSSPSPHAFKLLPCRYHHRTSRLAACWSTPPQSRVPKPERPRPSTELTRRVQVKRHRSCNVRSTSTHLFPSRRRWLRSNRSTLCLRRFVCCLASSQLHRRVPCAPTQAAAARRRRARCRACRVVKVRSPRKRTAQQRAHARSHRPPSRRLNPQLPSPQPNSPTAIEPY